MSRTCQHEHREECLELLDSLYRHPTKKSRLMNRWIMSFFVVLIMIGVAEAHSGDRLYPFYELTDEMLEKIDLHDGLIDEWYEIGEPNMTLLDFKTNRNFIAPDPSNLDFRIWLAWHDRSRKPI